METKCKIFDVVELNSIKINQTNILVHFNYTWPQFAYQRYITMLTGNMASNYMFSANKTVHPTETCQSNM